MGFYLGRKVSAGRCLGSAYSWTDNVRPQTSVRPMYSRHPAMHRHQLPRGTPVNIPRHESSARHHPFAEQTSSLFPRKPLLLVEQSLTTMRKHHHCPPDALRTKQPKRRWSMLRKQDQPSPPRNDPSQRLRQNLQHCPQHRMRYTTRRLSVRLYSSSLVYRSYQRDT